MFARFLMASATALVCTMASTPATAADAFVPGTPIRAATTPNYPPMTYRDPATSTLMGFDVELGNAIAAKLGSKIEWQDTSFEQLSSGLATGRFDLMMAGIQDTPARREVMDLVDYAKSGAVIYVSAQRAGEYKSLTDVCGKAIGGARKTAFVAALESWSQENCVKAGKEAVRVTGTESSSDTRAQLKQKRIDGGVQGVETIGYSMELEPNTYYPVGEPISSVLLGIAISKKNPGIRDAVAGAMKALIADGTYAQLVQKYKISGSAIEHTGVNGTPLK